MSIATLIIGESGSGKTASLRNLPANQALLIQCIAKPLPFKSNDWQLRSKSDNGNPIGNIYRTAKTQSIITAMQRSEHPIVIIDDYQACLLNEMLERSAEKGYDKYLDIAKGAWELFEAAGKLSEHRRIYILAHTQTGDDNYTRMKTVGRMVDEKIVPEGYFTIVLKTEYMNGNYLFATQTNGKDCCKSPLELFDSEYIENDLSEVDRAICKYYGIHNLNTETAKTS